MTDDAKAQQRATALEKAQKIRLAKAELKRSWSGRPQHEVLVEIAARLEDPDGGLDSFKIVELLTAVSGIGRTKAKFIAHAAEWVELTHRVSRLTERQRGVLARVLRQRASEVEAKHAQAA